MLHRQREEVTGAFRSACLCGEYKKIDEYLEDTRKLASIDFEEFHYLTKKRLLHELIDKMDLIVLEKVVEVSYKKSVGVNLRDKLGLSILYHVCHISTGFFDAIMRIYELNVNAPLYAPKHDTRPRPSKPIGGPLIPLSHLIYNRVNDKAKFLLEHMNIDVNCVDDTDAMERTPFYVACEQNNVEMAKLMIIRPYVQRNKPNSFGITPFMESCTHTDWTMAREFMRHFTLEELYKPLFAKVKVEGRQRHRITALKFLICLSNEHPSNRDFMEKFFVRFSIMQLMINYGEIGFVLSLINNPSLRLDKLFLLLNVGPSYRITSILIYRELLRSPYFDIKKMHLEHCVESVPFLNEILASRHHNRFKLADYSRIWAPFEEYHENPKGAHMKMRLQLGLAHEDASLVMLLVNVAREGLLKVTTNYKQVEVRNWCMHDTCDPSEILRFLNIIMVMPQELVMNIIDSVYGIKREFIPIQDVLRATKRIHLFL